MIALEGTNSIVYSIAIRIFTKSLGAFFPRLILGQGKQSEKKVIFLSFGAKVFDKEV